MAARVGIPRALFYYTYFPLWQAFFEKLGVEVVFSRPTNKEILEAGIKETVNDACIPIKLFHGHVLDLKDRVDYLLVPRLVSAGGYITFCPKFLGLPDMIRFSGMKLPALISHRLSLHGLPGGLSRFLRATALSLGIKNPLTQQKAIFHSLKSHKLYHRLLLEGKQPQEAFTFMLQQGRTGGRRTGRAAVAETGAGLPRVALLGYPYTIYDTFVSADVYQKLQSMNVSVITPDQISPQELRRMSRVLPQNLFWYYSNRVCWAGLSLLQHKAVDGMIHLTAFACGPDAMVDKLLELEAKKAKVPFLTLTIDEHTGAGGVQTRLEAFLDMLQAKLENNRNGV